MATHQFTHDEIEARAKQVESILGERLPVTLWMHLLSLTEDYLQARGLLTLSRWRVAAEDLGVQARDLRAAFEDSAP